MKRIATKQTHRYVVQLPEKLQAALLPLVALESPEAAAHLGTVVEMRGADVVVPLTNHHLLVVARVAHQHQDLPQALNLFNLIASEIA